MSMMNLMKASQRKIPPHVAAVLVSINIFIDDYYM